MKINNLLMYSINDLVSLWDKENAAYKSKEIGSGVQMFVKKLLQCEALFALKERPFFLDGNRSKIIFSQRRRGAELQGRRGAN